MGVFCPRYPCTGGKKLPSRNVERIQGGLVFKAHRLLYHLTLSSRVIKKKKHRPNVFGARRLLSHSALGLRVVKRERTFPRWADDMSRQDKSVSRKDDSVSKRMRVCQGSTRVSLGRMRVCPGRRRAKVHFPEGLVERAAGDAALRERKEHPFEPAIHEKARV